MFNHSAPSSRSVYLASLALCFAAWLLTPASNAWAQEPAAAAAQTSEPLVVAVREVPPFAMRDESGDWQGISVDLWREVADQLGIAFDWRELPLDKTLELLNSGDVDVGVAAISVTGERDKLIDFSHPYYVTGLSPAFASSGESAWIATLRGFFSLEFLSAVGSLALVLLIAGFFIWVFERRANAEQFGHGNIRRGLGDGFWWSAVTMTTVGYGDKAPVTAGGRVVALIWMFVSLIIIASFTASIAASLTANQLNASTNHESQLSRMTVGVLRGSAAEEYAASRGATTRPFDSIADAVAALAGGQFDTVIHDSPILRYQVRKSGAAVEVSERILVRDDYAFAFRESSPLRRDVNITLLGVLYEPLWQNIKTRYLGDTPDEIR